MNSVRARLLVALLSALVLIGVVSGGASYVRARGEIDRILDYQLRQHALSVRDQQYRGEGDALPGQDIVVQVWDRRGGRLYLSHRSQPLPLQHELGYSTIEDQGEKWRVYSVLMGDDLIQVGQPIRLRRQLATDAALRLLLPIFVAIPLLGMLTWWIVGRSLRPLRDLAGAIERRAPNALMPLQMDRIPAEARPMVDALNGLLARLGVALSQLKDFTSDAAHELRTPLTAVKLQAQLLARAVSEADRAEALAALQAGIDRAVRLVERMLMLARLEPEVIAEPFVDCDLRQAAQSVIDAQRPLALGKSINLTLVPGEPVVVPAAAEALQAMIRNLVDNAIAYTQSGGSVTVDVARVEGGARLRIIDNGPGIPPSQREHVLERFVRLSNHVEAHEDTGRADRSTGSGLGLAIVQRVVQLHRARLEFTDAPSGQGLCVVVTFPDANRSVGAGA
jgi:two-component system OmpR family sensor kinase